MGGKLFLEIFLCATLAAALAGCQTSDVTVYAYDTSTVTLGQDAVATHQERGGQTTDAVNPAVTTGDVQGVPGL